MQFTDITWKSPSYDGPSIIVYIIMYSNSKSIGLLIKLDLLINTTFNYDKLISMEFYVHKTYELHVIHFWGHLESFLDFFT